MNILIISDCPYSCHEARTTISYLFTRYEIEECRHADSLIVLEQLKRDGIKPNLILFDIDSKVLSEAEKSVLLNYCSKSDYFAENHILLLIGSYSHELEIRQAPLLMKPFSINQMGSFLRRNYVRKAHAQPYLTKLDGELGKSLAF
ncbi:hypothetical protein M9194_14870 [Vibrio sp. S4M6]|uniref:hypothetical protein n=1 Tax=Vibrio sinus TaxID=2946865 RepID=UPI00202A39DC|nr:hypothetical protein [Vibrio sinus]MCL9782716.1 hypothetical protein [Vibrio sinus]